MTIGEALRILYAYTSDDANPPGSGRSETYREGYDALAALLSEREAARDALDDVESHLVAADAILSVGIPNSAEFRARNEIRIAKAKARAALASWGSSQTGEPR